MEKHSNIISDSYSIKDTYKIIKNKDNNMVDSLIVIRNKDTKEILYTCKNKSLLSLSEFFSMRAFDIDDNYFITPTYNNKLQLENQPSISDSNIKCKSNDYKISLFCIGTSGAATGSLIKYEVSKQRWIHPDHLIPFRYPTLGNDLDNNQRQIYFGRKILGNNIAYYFKKFDSEPTIIKKYEDNSVDWSNNVYEVNSDLAAQVIVFCKMTITKEDCRDYFINTTGASSARFNCLSLCLAWSNMIDNQTYYQDIRAVTRFNTSDKSLNEAITYEIEYSMYF